MSLIAELKRRNVFRVGIAYVVGSWLLVQVADLALQVIGAEGWVLRAVVVLLALGFVPALIFAWAFELTPEGLKKESQVDPSRSITRHTAKKLDLVTIGLLLIAIALLAVDRLVPESPSEPAAAPVAEAPSATGAVHPTQSADSAPAQEVSRQSVAVLPFANRSADAEDSRFFSDGIHDDLLTHLSRIRDLKVISRTSVLAYRDTEKNMRQIGEELGVANLLEGGVQRAGNRVRINAQLIDARTDEHLWAETFDRELTTENIFEIQQDIALAIARALEATLTPEEESELGTVPTQDLVAYQEWLVARQLRDRNTFESLATASQKLQRVVERDPEFEQAWVDLASVEISLVLTGAKPAAEARSLIEPALDIALQKNPDNGDAWSNKGAWLLMTGQDGGEELLEKSVRLSPGNAEVLMTYGYHQYRQRGRPDLALPALQRAAELNPLSASYAFGLGRAYEGLGRKQDAWNFYARTRSIDPASAMGYAGASGFEESAGNVAAALHWMQEAVKRDPGDFELVSTVADIWMTLGDLAEAERWAQRAVAGGADQPRPLAARAVLHALNGQTAAGLELARFAIRNQLPDRWGSDAVFLRILRNEALRSGAFDEALGAFRSRHPELFDTPPVIVQQNVLQAVDLAPLLLRGDRVERGRALLLAAVEAYGQPYFASGHYVLPIVPAKAEALALLGERDAAIAELQRIVHDGWRSSWRWETELNPNFDTLQNDPRFGAIVTFIAEDMAAQREQARDRMARNDVGF